MIGDILVKAAFAACLVSSLAYFLHHLRGTPGLLKVGRISFFVTFGAVVATAVYLLSLILTHQFQYTYVWSYSSRELSTPLLVSTFYAGQEGSFLLWILYTSLIGLFLIRHSARMGYESQVMSVYALIDLMLILMILVKNPFLTVWQSWPGQVEAGFIPPNGRGLNPLLQNYWMVIHPQVLFSGFSAMGVPYAYAMAALMKRDYTQWIKPATPWLIFGALVLGTGIMMGGFWAYETLGWGGYWGWDPVENSSLVPWLFCIACIHMVLSQRKTGGFIKTSLVLGMLCFLMVLYSTFLTRSGVLGETSVHSFVDPGMAVYWLLVGLIVLFATLGVVTLVRRWKEIPKPVAQHNYYSREFALFLGATAIVAAAVLITVGTSSPIITDIAQGKKSAVDIAYYSTTILPIGILVGILAGLGQLLWWTRSDRSEVLKTLIAPAVLALVATGALAIVGVSDILVALFVFGSAFALFANIQVALRIFKGNPKYMGGSVAHVGLAVMFLGFVASSHYDTKETISLVQGQPVKALGYTLTYQGYKPVDSEKYAFHVTVEKDGRRYAVAPIMYYSSYNDGLMRNPDIVNLITKDFYLAPLSLEQPGDQQKGTIEKSTLKTGETKKIGNLKITFLGFDLPVMHTAAMMEGKDITIGAKLSVSRDGSPPRTVTPVKVIRDGRTSDVSALFEERFEFTIAGLSPDRESRENSTVEIAVRDVMQAVGQPSAPDILVAEASVKPYINLVWAGVIILLVGFLVTIVRRAQEAAMKAEAV